MGVSWIRMFYNGVFFVIFLDGKKEMKLLNFEVWFYIYLTSRKSFFLSKKEIITDF